MKPYVCHKNVVARPMNRQEYNDYRGWELPADENGTDEGYLVEYIDGGEQNHPDHKGYISWSPKDVFERGYTTTEKRELLPHQQRVIAEADELLMNLTKLNQFRATDMFAKLSNEDRWLLERQSGVMTEYYSILTQRIVSFYNPSIYAPNVTTTCGE